MKTNCLARSTLLSVLALVSFAGCNSSAQLGITKDSDSPSAQTAPGTTNQDSKNQAGTSSSGTPTGPADINPLTIAFEQVRLRDGMLPIINGLGFLSGDSTVDAPFVVNIENAVEIAAIQPFLPISGGILMAAISSDTSSKGASLDLMDTTTLGSTSLLDVNGITSFTSTSDGSIVGWTTQSGAAFVSQTPFASNVQLELKGSNALQITSRGASSTFYVTTNAVPAQTLVFEYPSPKAVQNLPANTVALSPSGNRVLLIGGPNLQVYNTLDQTTTPIAGTYDVHEADWRDEETVSFWSESNGAISLQTLDILKGDLNSVTALDSLVSTGNISCPRWSADALYFGDYRDSKYSIFKAEISSGTWKVSGFAEPDDSRFGYICPRPEN